MLRDMRKCEIYPSISGRQEIKTSHAGNRTCMLRGGPACAIWFRRPIDLPEVGKVWNLNEDEWNFRATGSGSGYHQLARRSIRYERMRIDD